MQTWRYHPNKKAKIFDTDVDDMDALAKQGWCESPADFKAEAEQQETALEGRDEEREQLKARFNEDLEGRDEEREQLKARFNEDLERRDEEREQLKARFNEDLEGHDEERDQLMARFNEDPEQLDKDELVKLGRYLGVKMMKAWKPDTLIKKVRSGLE
jgi:DNA repair exonuclease SbcCD ATPase subunit